MVVIVIIGLLATIVIINVMPAADRAAMTKAQADIATLEQGVEMYRLDNLRYPTARRGCRRSSAEGYVKRLPNDPWGNPYRLRRAGPRRARRSTSTATGPTAAKAAKARMRTSATGK